MFLLPPRRTSPLGGERKCGFEIEYTNLRPIESAQVVVELFGGEIQKIDEYEVSVHKTRYGDFTIYLDSIYLRADNEKYLFKEHHLFKELIYSISENVIPYEMVTPPFVFGALEEAERLKEALRKSGAVGTNASILYAFGLHINIEAFSFEATHLRDILRAFVLMEDWIKETIEVDLTRKLSWFIEPFDKEYINLILQKEYNPDLQSLIEDYILYNPTRNRALDMLPLFAYLHPSIKTKLPPQKLTPRPAFHYRLPNSKIDEKEWSLAKEFNIWTLVERAALNQEALTELIEDFWEFENSPYWFIKELWIERVQEWLQELS